MPGTYNTDPKRLSLFGGSLPWNASEWTASDDRVRGGKSQSFLDYTDDIARFHGTLDIATLGGAGFASQRTTADDREWDLSAYQGIELSIADGDQKRYTFNLKDELLPPDPDTGREQASISWEYDFQLPASGGPDDAQDKTVFIPWGSFNATYRGRPKEDAAPLDVQKIRRFSIMMRSFFAAQDGEFSLSLRAISALSCVPETADDAAWDPSALEKGQAGSSSIHVRDVETSAVGRSAYLFLGAAGLALFYIFMRTWGRGRK